MLINISLSKHDNIELYGTIRLDHKVTYDLNSDEFIRIQGSTHTSITATQFFEDVLAAKMMEHYDSNNDKWLPDTVVERTRSGENVYVSGIGRDKVAVTLEQLQTIAKLVVKE